MSALYDKILRVITDEKLSPWGEFSNAYGTDVDPETLAREFLEPLWDDENITLFLKELRETCEGEITNGELYEKSRQENSLLREKNRLLTENDKLQTESIRLLEEVNKKLEEKVETKTTVLEWVKDENEVNKKNMFKFMKEARELAEELRLLEKYMDDKVSELEDDLEMEKARF